MSNALIVGGSFDPVHLAHVATIEAIIAQIPFDRTIFIPCKSPILKAPLKATAEQRLAMLSLALEDTPFEIDPLELKRSTPSYTVTTLENYRAGYGADYCLSLVLGQDAFNDLKNWHQWEKIGLLTNVLVIQRPDYSIQHPTISHLTPTQNSQDLLTTPQGLIFYMDAGQYSISSTHIRKQLSLGKRLEPHLLHPKVEAYILKHQLYFPFA